MRCLFDKKRLKFLISLNTVTFGTMKCMARLLPWVFIIVSCNFINLERREHYQAGKAPVTN